MVGNVYIGANVKQRAQLGENYLDGVEVLAVNGRKNIGMIAQILKDHGANVVEFRWSLENIGEISRRIRQADIFLDGVQQGGELEEASASSPRLIVAECDCEDPFSSMSAVARISMALAARERSGHGQRLIASDSLEYWRHLNRFGKNQ
ncbi:hypothetical protein L5515_013061 [Caenorhabditis briggsae]|uniref:Uncharacterized protein n=1 Tax=Caenorhabditis briggsae TaxID=6238 RepID=A0AAE9J6G5_CAEBR|nr:hypothetical protein L5515_013061 [Caenorhabditis briggsae]